ncbi:RNA polymerase sigma factor [Conexibacter woesei]|uniref:RNA polymerase sigma factor n=1 Tax=Conexibacter woesei TaxID=191495 RepID=UPI0004235C5F|nr:RNA polymerase sigma factor [Conexibacter woesei]
MEVSALKLHGASGLRGPTPLLRLQGDERLVALTRKGNQAAYEALVARYQARLLAFCRHMLASREDAEDVLQEVFAAAFNAMLADDRPINVRPWLYRIARNRCLNHLRKQTAIGVDSMDVHLAENGTSTADKVHDREEFRELVADVQTLAETQRTALLLREIDALSYEQIAEAMETTVPSVKSLLVRARVSLAEAAEARKLTCVEVRDELGMWAEGLESISAPVRRHVRGCQRCGSFKKQLKANNKALAAVLPIGPLLVFKKFLLAQGASGVAGASAGGGAAATGTVAAGGMTTGGALSAGVGAVATKAAAGLAAVALVTTGAVEVDHVKQHRFAGASAAAAQVSAAPKAVAAAPPAAAPAPTAVSSAPQGTAGHAAAGKGGPGGHGSGSGTAASTAQPAGTTTATEQNTATAALPPSTATPGGTQEGYDDTRLPDQSQTAAAPMTPAPATPAPAQPAPAADPQPSTAGQPATTTAPPSDPTTTTSEPTAADPAPPADGTSPSTTTPPASTTTPSEPSSTTPSDGDPSSSSTTPAN